MPISGREAIKILERNGYTVVRQRGSHVILRKESESGRRSVHKELKKGTLRGIAQLAGVSVKQFGL